MKTIQLRASAAPRFTKCPGSAFLPQVRTVSAAAALGTAVHKCCEAIVKGEAPDVAGIAALDGIPFAELDGLTWSARALWQEYGSHFPGALTEVELGPEKIGLDAETTGHADIVAIPHDGTIRIADWKSGWREGDYNAQLKTYAYLAWRETDRLDSDLFMADGINRVYVAIFWLRDRSIEGQWYDTATLARWGEKLSNDVLAGRLGQLSIGEHCAYCPVAQCPALRDRALALLNTESPIEILEPADVVLLNDFRKAAEKRLEDIKLAIHQYFQINVPIDVGGGRELGLVETIRETIKPNSEAFEYLLSTFTPEELYDLITISKTALTAAVREKAGRGAKKSAEELLMNQMRKLGAVQESPSTSITTHKKETA